MTLNFFKKKTLDSNELYLLSWHLGLLLQAKTPLLHALELIQTYPVSQCFKKTIQSLKQALLLGHSFTDALQQYPQSFSPFYCYVILLGEKNGMLAQTLNLLAQLIQQKNKIKQAIMQALIYPVFLLLACLCLFIFLLVETLPQLETLYNMSTLQANVTVLSLFRMSHLLMQKSMLVISFFLSLSVTFFFLWHTAFFQRLRLRGLMRIQYFKQFITNYHTLLFSQGLKIHLKAQGDLPCFLNLIATLLPLPVFQKALHEAHHHLKQGDFLGIALMKTQRFPELFCTLISAGEQAGVLNHTVEHLCAHYHTIVQEQTASFLRLVGPVALTLAGLLLTALVICFYAPLLALTSSPLG